MSLELMRRRRSIRKFKKEMPAKEMLEELVVAASLAPSASNKQPWRFMIIRSRELIESAGRLVNARREELISQVEEDFRARFAEYSENFIIFQQAPALIIPICRPIPMLSQLLSKEVRHEVMEDVVRLEANSALISISCAIQNMLLMAEDIGLGACCMTGPLIAAEQLKEIFKIPEGWEPVAFLAVGYADEQPFMPERKPVDSIIKWLD
jgi:nitroreductase